MCSPHFENSFLNAFNPQFSQRKLPKTNNLNETVKLLKYRSYSTKHNPMAKSVAQSNQSDHDAQHANMNSKLGLNMILLQNASLDSNQSQNESGKNN